MSNDAPIRDHKAWLGYVQQDGLVVSPTALVDAQVVLDRNTLPMQERFLPFTKEVTDNDDNALIAIADFPKFAREFLGWPEDCLHGLDSARPLPDALTVALPDYGETLAPSFALKDARPKDPAQPWLLLVQSVPLATDLDARVAADERGWSASPTQRMERLLRETKVPIGVLFNGTQIRLLYAPHGENSGNITFTVRHMTEVAGRPILAALNMLLREACSGATPSEARLPALLRRSREYQSTVSTTLAQQVLDSLYELLRGFQAADERAKGELLRAVLAKNPDDVYAGLLNVLMRMVFLLFAEDRGIVPTDPKSRQPTETYVRYYSVHGLFERLRADAERYPDTMDQRYGAWAQLLALFRAVHDGCKHPQMQMPARHGHLFDPDRFKFLEGRTLAEPRLPLVSDGTIFRVLHKLFILDGERLSYRTLDVQEIGSVYQTIMGFAIEVSGGQSIALKGKRKNGSVPASPVVNLETLLAVKSAERAKWLKENADTELNGEAEKKLKAAASVDDLLAALEKRIDRGATPGPVPNGGLVLQPTDERRRSGSHYTPRSFTEPIVRKTLEPILKRLGEHPTPAQILELKICDIAVGSAAFLVETCRQLGDALVKAWRHHGGRPTLPDDETEELLAMRTVVQRCLYGVDRNPMAVDLAKLSLWLVTLAKDHPFTFVDHAIRCGDSLVGLTRSQIEDFTWHDTRTSARHFFSEEVRKRTAAALRERQNLLGLGDDYGTPQLKREKLEKADELLDLVRFIGDAAVSAFFAADKDKAREAKRAELAERLSDYLSKGDLKKRPTEEVNALRGGRFPVTPFHWEIEFPEVFIGENPGFDAIVGNPPYAGKNTLSKGNQDAYPDWLKAWHEQSHGNADLVAHFFRHAFDLLRAEGCFGLIATKTICQGDTRATGLRWICTHGGTIYAANKRYKWPGQASVVVSVVWATKADQHGPFELDGRLVPVITAYLFHAGGHESPTVLTANADRSFQGSIVLGMGFTFDDTDNKHVANSIEDMRRLFATDPRNSEQVFPYIGGEEVTDTPAHSHHRYVINFFDWPLNRADLGSSWASGTDRERREWLNEGVVPLDYPGKVASDYPDLLRIIETKVKGTRASHSTAHWWHFERLRGELYQAVAGLERVLAINCGATPHMSFAFLPSRMVFGNTLDVFPLETFAAFGALQSRVHELWARRESSSMKDDLRYTPTDCFETFPFPIEFEGDASLEAAGREYYEFRAALMVRNNDGLTKTYNRFHDPEERSPDILKLRDLHAAMDAAVLTAYGWDDLIPKCTCEFLLDYEDEEDDESEGKARKRKKPWRYRWPDEIRDEVLARLLKLNAERAKEEELAGQTAAAQKPKPKKASAKAPKTGKAQLALGIATPDATERKLPADWRLPASQPLLYTTNLALTLLSEAGGSLAWPRLLDAFILATNPKLMQRFAPAELSAQAKAWAARWNETVPDGLLIPSLNQLGSRNLTITEGNDGPVFHLLDGPRPSLSDDVRFDAWLALRVAATLTPDAVPIPQRAKWTKEAKELVLA
ncbi:MAG: class I SAM-dependent DNA methyltransferase [Verrucomicrobiae bacterium]|nr:class I SAM-dependent DNA methyltransferase [Verrucomicrobiae bacterium]